ncbi:glycoside hydrolase family 127 protein [Panacibacter ginsenosidivorans]|uniref:Glycoside hydrolase family 127 protein n=1 Tax=Panacibacter ginsenosidivorans TaxID=1813871 RepID=A0A5B8VAK0_9BACT|nr:beta-L-arabinofuranosidase domain-containing protein [Panacibacter ginsenosidivorans]QEC67983.1 glycoside hydrolase family 127 protein [Panacibacter ginsenosidivorans]
MKRIILSFSLLSTTFLFAQKKDYPIQAVPFTSVKLTDNFWLPRIKMNATVTIPASFERCESTGRVKNFVMAATHQGKFCTIYPFDDTDIYKTIEGASYSLSLFPDVKLAAYLDSLITIIGKAQEPDGYLYTARTINPNDVGAWVGKQRWEKERELSHELYNAGHLYEAAAAHYMATGKRNLLDIALKNADLVCSVFGPGKRHVAPGHEIVEMGLVKLYRISGKPEYLATAKDFIEYRGHYNGYDSTSKDEWKNGMYWQDDKPVVDQREAEGHAVRAGYLYSGVADIAALTGDQQLLAAVDSIWTNVVTKKMYVQGGAGAIGDGERYGENYELPNETAYNETCAAIANIFWNQRMFLLHGDSKYIDVMEKILYNGFISGIGLDGKSFFYTNAMQIKNTFSHADMEAQRSGWFPCSCCPTNDVRILPSIPGYVYAQKDDKLFVNLFINGTSNMKVMDKDVSVEQQNNYPWDGDLKFIVNTKKPSNFSMLVRIPGWAKGIAMPSDLYTFKNQMRIQVQIPITVNGQPVEYEMENGYAVIKRIWKKNDVVEVKLPMNVERVVANENVKSDIGKVALQRGPVIYCAEWKDNEGRAANIVMPDAATFTTEFKQDMLNGIQVIKSTVPAVIVDANGETVQTKQQPFVAIPYYAWANRGKGEMMIWFPEKVKDVDIIAGE